MNIATRIRLLGPTLVLLTAVLVGLVGYWGYRALVAEEQLVSLTTQVGAEGQRLTLALREIQNDVRLLSRLPALREFSAATAGLSLDADSAAVWRERTANIFSSMLRSKPHYEQIRLIGLADEGRELIRIQRRQGVAARIPDSDLQGKDERDYFAATLALEPDRIHVSDISLNRELGIVEIPHRPTLRAAVPIYLYDGRQFGLVVLNMNFESFIDDLFSAGNEIFDHYLSNTRGDYVLHPDRSRVYGFDLGTAYRLQDEFPELAAIFTPGTSAATTELNPNGASASGLVHFERIYPFIDEPDRFLVIGLGSTFDQITTSSAEIGVQVVVLTLVLLILAGLAAYLLAQRLIEPLSALTTTAEQLSDDQQIDFPGYTRDDEIGHLSRALSQMVRSLNRQRSHLRAANVDLEYFARIASHDLREPARRMGMLANLLQFEQRDRVTESGREVLQRIRDEGQRMVDQLTDLRAFSRLGRDALQRQDTDVAALIRSVLSRYRQEIDDRKVVTSIETLPTVPVYRGLLEMLYDNLISNALQHVPGDGFLLTFTYTERDGEHVFGVSNTGSSIDTAAETLFQPFHPSTGGREHSGLGLSICRRIVERHAGHIWATSDTHHVHFQFTLTGASRDQ